MRAELAERGREVGVWCARSWLRCERAVDGSGEARCQRGESG
jgi:hypothetical protein